MSTFFVYTNGVGVTNVEEIVDIYRNSSEEVLPFSIFFKNGQILKVNEDYAQRLVAFIKKQCEKRKDESVKVGSFAVDAMESYAEFYEQVLAALGFPKDANPSAQQDTVMLQKISELVEFYKSMTDESNIANRKGE